VYYILSGDLLNLNIIKILWVICRFKPVHIKQKFENIELFKSLKYTFKLFEIRE